MKTANEEERTSNKEEFANKCDPEADFEVLKLLGGGGDNAVIIYKNQISYFFRRFWIECARNWRNSLLAIVRECLESD